MTFTQEWIDAQNAKRAKKSPKAPREQDIYDAVREYREQHPDCVGAQVSNPEQGKPKVALESFGERKARGARCPVVRFTLCRVKLLDVDAKYASVKDLLDGLQYAGLIHGDKEGQITLEVLQEKVSSFKDEQTVIEVLL